MKSQTWCVVIEDETGTQEIVSEGLTETRAREFAAEIEARETFWAEARPE